MLKRAINTPNLTAGKLTATFPISADPTAVPFGLLLRHTLILFFSVFFFFFFSFPPFASRLPSLSPPLIFPKFEFPPPIRIYDRSVVISILENRRKLPPFARKEAALYPWSAAIRAVELGSGFCHRSGGLLVADVGGFGGVRLDLGEEWGGSGTRRRVSGWRRTTRRRARSRRGQSSMGGSRLRSGSWRRPWACSSSSSPASFVSM